MFLSGAEWSKRLASAENATRRRIRTVERPDGLKVAVQEILVQVASEVVAQDYEEAVKSVNLTTERAQASPTVATQLLDELKSAHLPTNLLTLDDEDQGTAALKKRKSKGGGGGGGGGSKTAARAAAAGTKEGPKEGTRKGGCNLAIAKIAAKQGGLSQGAGGGAMMRPPRPSVACMPCLPRASARPAQPAP